MACQHCLKNIHTKKEQVTCRGYCGSTFHAVCVNVDGPLQQQLAENPKNVFWMCNGCAGLFTNAHFRSMMSNVDKQSSDIAVAVQAMQSEVEKLQSAVSALAARIEDKTSTPTPFATPNLWPIRNRFNTPISSIKRRRGNDGNLLDLPKAVSKVGTKSAVDIRTVQLNQRDDGNMLWLYLSAFHPTTSETQIASLVSECLELSNTAPKVVKLVPKGRDLDSLQFVSFKVGIDVQLKDKALSSDSWPENVRFREFEDHRSKNVPKIVSLMPTVPPGINQPPQTDATEANMDN